MRSEIVQARSRFHLIAVVSALLLTTGLGIVIAPSPVDAAWSDWSQVTLPSGWSMPAGDPVALACTPATTHCVSAALGPSGWGTLVTSNLVNWTGYEGLPAAFGPGDTVSSISCPTTTQCVAVGSTASDSTAITVSSDGGETWTSASTVPSVSGGWAWSVSCPSATVCYVVGGRSQGPSAPLVGVSTDGGSVWTNLSANVPTPANYYLDGVSCTSASDCVAVGQFGHTATSNATAITTNDGGATWSQTAAADLTAIQQMYAVSCIVGSSTCWSAGILYGATDPTLLESQNSGGSWTSNSFTGGGWFSSVSCADGSTCWTGGAGTDLSLLGTDDGGSTFSGIYASTSNQETTVSCASDEVCAATTDNGLFVTTTNGGIAPGEGSPAPGNGGSAPPSGGQSAPPPPAGMGSISGTVTVNGSPLSRVCVYAIATNSLVPNYQTTTASDGSYALDLSPDTYNIEFDPTCSGGSSSPYAIQFYDDEPDLGSATDISVAAAQSVDDVNGALAAGATITGTLTGPNGVVDGVCVTADSYSTGFAVNGAVTAANGSYSIPNLPADSYSVFFDPTCGYENPSSLSMQWNGAAPDFESAGAIVVGTGATVSGVSTTLVVGATIYGTVTAASGVNSGDVCIEVLDSRYGDDVGFGVTDDNGEFIASNLPPYTYIVAIDPTCLGLQESDYVPGYVGGSSFGTASLFTLSAGGSQSVNTSMTPATPPVISTTSLPSGTVGSSYSATMSANGGTGGYEWSATGLPAGASIDSASGAISGSLTAAGNFSASVTVTDDSVPPVSTTVVLSGTIAAEPPSPQIVSLLPTPTPSGPVPRVSVATTTATATSSAVPLRLTCQKSACGGSAKLTEIVKESSKKGKKTVTKSVTVVLADTSFHLSKGKSGVANLAFTSTGRSDFAHARTHPVTVTLTVTVRGGDTTTKRFVVK